MFAWVGVLIGVRGARLPGLDFAALTLAQERIISNERGLEKRIMFIRSAYQNIEGSRSRTTVTWSIGCPNLLEYS
jgi:hypothetical protein